MKLWRMKKIDSDDILSSVLGGQVPALWLGLSPCSCLFPGDLVTRPDLVANGIGSSGLLHIGHAHFSDMLRRAFPTISLLGLFPVRVRWLACLGLVIAPCAGFPADDYKYEYTPSYQ